MSLPIYADAYAGYRANERPRRFTLDDNTYEIAGVEDRWREPDAEYFKVRTTDSKTYLLRYEEQGDVWTLQSGFDGDILLARPDTEVVTVDPAHIRQAQTRVAGCEGFRGDAAEIPSELPLADSLDKHCANEIVMADVAHCPNCTGSISEKTLVEIEGGVGTEAMV